MNKIKYAIYHGDSETGGVYNVLASFLRGILKGFQEADLCAYTYQECIEKNIPEEQAVEKLIELIRSNGDYVDQ